MPRGFSSWIVTDDFDQKWRLWIVPVSERVFDDIRASRWDEPDNPLFHLIYCGFDRSRALDDELASALLSIYDALTGSHLSEDFPYPTRDPQRRLRGFKPELKRVLYNALERGVLKYEPIEMTWPFPEVEEKPEDRPPPMTEESTKLPIVEIFLDVPRASTELGDFYVLESTDGSFAQTQGRPASSRVDERKLVLKFRDVEPGKTYDLFQRAGEARLYVFRAVPFGTLGNHGSDTPIPKPRPEPTARTPDPVPTAEDELIAMADVDQTDDPSLVDTDPRTAFA